MIRYVCLSDLHLGAPNSLLSHVGHGADDVDVTGPSRVLEAVAACLADLVADVNGPGGPEPELILNGDVLELALANDDEAIGTFEHFVRTVWAAGARFRRIVYLPGNHDHHLWETTREEAYAGYVATRPHGEPLRSPDHATPVFDQPTPPVTAPHGFGSSLLDAVVHRELGKGSPAVDIRYPLFGIRADVGDREVLVHHGHFVEPVYQLMSRIRQTGFPASPAPPSMAAIESENFAWIDYFWSTLGRSGDVGRDVSFVYNMVQDETAAKLLAGNFSRPLAEKLPRWVPGRHRAARWAFRKAADVLLDHQRIQEENPARPDRKGRLRALLEHTLAQDLGATVDRPHPAPVTFLYGHTHMPFGKAFRVPGFARPVIVHNTGGWVVDEVTPAVGLGGAVVLLDESLAAVRVDLFRQLPHAGVERPHAESVAGDGDGSFLIEVDEVLRAARAPWRDLRPIVEETMEARRDGVRRAIDRGIREASRAPRE